MTRRLSLRFGAGLLTAVVALPQRTHAQLAPNAPQDRPTDATECQWRALTRAIEPLVRQARATLPAAITRFRAGLPPKEGFFVTVRLHDSTGHQEQVFVAVDSVGDSGIQGRIASPIDLVRGYRRGQRFTARPDSAIDWMISKPDGSEEGNEVGKFLDTWVPPAQCRST